MNLDIAILLIEDGLASGAIYVLMALGFVLVFNVTRVIFVPFGDLVSYAALTLASFQLQRTPGTIWLLVTLAALAILLEVLRLYRIGQFARLPRALVVWGVLPLLPVACTLLLDGFALPSYVAIPLTFALILPIGPLLYRIVFQPIANAPVLVLLMVSVALHFAVSGLALMYFGPEGMRTTPLVQGAFDLFGIAISASLLLIVGVAAALSIALLLFFRLTLTGKALLATASNREGARLVGIRTATTSAAAFLVAGIIATVAGVLISPMTTIYYDTGLIVGLKGFVGSVAGGFVSYPLAALGGVIIGQVESFSSFYASAFKEAIVFAAVIPVILARWLWASNAHIEEHDEE